MDRSEFKCDECTRTFKNANGLRLHGRTHAKEGQEKKDIADDKDAEKGNQDEGGSSSIEEEEEKSLVKSKTPTKKKRAATVTPQKKRSPTRSASPKTPKNETPNKKVKAKKAQDTPFKIGAVLEGENNDPELLLYVDTIHSVEYVGFSEKGPDLHRCRMLAFHGRPIFEWNGHELHEKRPEEDDKEKEFEVGEQVHVLLKNRCGIDEDGKEIDTLDGHLAKIGVWVKAKVVEIDKTTGKITVDHVKWSIPDKNKNRAQTSVDKKDVRKDWTK